MWPCKVSVPRQTLFVLGLRGLVRHTRASQHMVKVQRGGGAPGAWGMRSGGEVERAEQRHDHTTHTGMEHARQSAPDFVFVLN